MLGAMTTRGSDADTTRGTLWVGRVRRPDDRRVFAVRTFTQGDAPAPDAEVEAIPDPFVDPEGDPWMIANGEALSDGPRGALTDFELLPPVRAPKVLCVGRNYRAHAKELGNEVPTEPLLFLKPSSALIVSGQSCTLPRGYPRIDMESELVLVIGRRARHVSAADAWQHVAGYTIGNDVSNRELQKKDGQWTRAKGHDGFAPVGSFVRMTPPGFVPPLDDMRIQGFLNDEPKQDGRLVDLIFPIPFLFEYVTAMMTLEPGDLVYTGTPEGVSALGPGDIVRVQLAGFDVGTLVTPFV
jgi:2-keto-4-pentenoate hydratase/2-oxohepta-3-ene-1,7-dioic acid hydratase in catechol pathway